MNNYLDFTDPFGLYLHIPFCIRKCNYCDFYSEQVDQKLISAYLSALLVELEIYRERLSINTVKTIYIGGGTPSLLEAELLEKILNQIRQYFTLMPEAEITIETNPSSLSKDKIVLYKELGINRLSLGVQSFNDDELKFLGRLHTSIQAIEVIREIKKHFHNFNLDLIFAIPGQTLKTWENTLNTAVSIKPSHLSIYNLQIEEGTVLGEMLANKEINQVEESLDAEMYLMAHKMLTKIGYHQYEISNFARKGFESKHNLMYWTYLPYLGLGPAAHSFNGQQRSANSSELNFYLKQLKQRKLPVTEIDHLTKKEQMAEMLFMGLRLLQGVSLEYFSHYFGVDLKQVYQKELTKLLKLKLIKFDQGYLKLTENGILLGNEVFMEFLP